MSAWKPRTLGRLGAASVMLLAAWVGQPVSAKVPSGLQCDDCHTMHNSQNNATVAGVNAISRLLVNDCIGCHTGTNTGANTTPYVFTTTEPVYPAATLAGGNFYWVSASPTTKDRKGHNVTGVTGVTMPDAAMGYTPPGYRAVDFPDVNNNPVGATWNATNSLSCAGTYGCHGTRTSTNQYLAMDKTHHANDTTIDGSTAGKSFRYLNGIHGKEHSGWEFGAADGTVNHNQYKGINKTAGQEATPSTLNRTTISYLCAQCHGDYHSGAGALGVDNPDTMVSPWIRHPSDYDMPTTGEYANYGAPGATYLVDVPLGSVNVAATLSSGLAANQRIVLCLSCHRAHGSPYDSLLRVNYKAWPGDATGNLCGVCHTSKN